MKKTSLFLLLALLCACTSFAQEKTLSPYFLVSSESKVEQFPLLSTTADVDIAGVIANVHVTQCYTNTGKTPIEAKYIFPASTNAAVYGMEMMVGKRKIKAKITERQAAKQQYAAAKKAGKTASLLEQERPNVFQMNVANILPGDEVEVHLFYTELLVPTEGVYEFVYPTVVGPRYAGETPQKLLAANKWVTNPYLPKGTPTPYQFGLNLKLNTGVPISAIQSSSHQINVNYRGKAQAIVDLKNKSGGNKDFILEYQLRGKQIEEG
ncbi:MAG: VIT domain-containing protein, partial [Saprospiraceae bacterium]